MAFDLRAPVPIRLERYINNIPTWTGDEVYNQGDVILRSNALYLALIGSEGTDPITVNAAWRHIGEGGGTNGIISALTVGQVYTVGTFFYFENNLYVNSAQFTAAVGDTLTSVTEIVNSPLTLVTFNPEFTGIESEVLISYYNTGLQVSGFEIPGHPTGVSVSGINEGVRIGTEVFFSTDMPSTSGMPYIVNGILHHGTQTIFILDRQDTGAFSINQTMWIVQGSNAAITQIEIAGRNNAQLRKDIVAGVLTIEARTLTTPQHAMPELMTSGGIYNALPKVYIAGTGGDDELVGLSDPMTVGNVVNYLLPADVTEANTPGIPGIYFPQGRQGDTGLRNDLTGEIGVLDDVQFGDPRSGRDTINFTFLAPWVPPTPTDDGTDIDDHVSQVTEHADPINSVSFSARESGYDEDADHLHISSQSYLDGRYAPLASATDDVVTGYRIEEGEVLGWTFGGTLREGVVLSGPFSGSVTVSGTGTQTFVFPVPHGFVDEDRFVIRTVHSAERWIYEVVSDINDMSVTAVLRSTQPDPESSIDTGTHSVEWAMLSIFDRGLFITTEAPLSLGFATNNGGLGLVGTSVNGFEFIPSGSTITVGDFTFVTRLNVAAEPALGTFTLSAVGFATIVATVGQEIFLTSSEITPFNAFESGRGLAPFDIDATGNATINVENVLFPEGGEYPSGLFDEATYTRGSVIVHDDKSWYYTSAADLVITVGLEIELDNVRLRTRNTDGTFAFTNIVADNRTDQLALVAPGNTIPIARWQELGALEANSTEINFQAAPGVVTDTPISSISDVATVDSFLNLEYNGATGSLQVSTHAALFRRILLTQGFLLPRSPTQDGNGREAYAGNLGTGLDTDPANVYWWDSSENAWYGSVDGDDEIVSF